MAASVRLFCLSCLVLSLAFADQVPVLIWSSDRPLSDLPQAPVTGSLSQEAFHSNYLTPLLDKPAPVLVTFLQDKLHINDISKYADVYNPDSDGGAFKNIKGQLDTHFSLELPHVDGSHLALDDLRHTFPGTVHHLSHDAADLHDDLDLQGQGLTLVIVRLRSVAEAPNEEAAIAANDELIGKISRHLEKRNIKYTALYTAEKSRSVQRESGERGSGRHLLEAEEVNSEGMFYNVSYGSATNGTLYAYLTSVSACVRPPFDPSKPPLTSCAFNFTVRNLNSSSMTATWDGKDTVRLTLNIANIKPKNSSLIYNFSLMMPFKHQKDRWEMVESQVNISNLSGGFTAMDFQLVTHGYDCMVPLLYSFHCTSMEWYPKNMSASPLVYIVLGGFQVQPFNTPSSGFLLSQDCVGWFTTAVWMGLLVVGLHVLILLGGLYLLASLTTNDRFDDPKGKPLNINAGE